MGLARYQTQLHRARLHTRPGRLWVWQDVKLNSLKLDYARGLSIWWSSKMLDSTSLGSSASQVQVHVGLALAKCHTQLHFTRLHAKPECMWINVRPNSFELDYKLGPSAWESGKMLDSAPLGSTIHQAQAFISLVRYQTQLYWVQLENARHCKRLFTELGLHSSQDLHVSVTSTVN